MLVHHFCHWVSAHWFLSNNVSTHIFAGSSFAQKESGKLAALLCIFLLLHPTESHEGNFCWTFVVDKILNVTSNKSDYGALQLFISSNSFYTTPQIIVVVFTFIWSAMLRYYFEKITSQNQTSVLIDLYIYIYIYIYILINNGCWQSLKWYT